MWLAFNHPGWRSAVADWHDVMPQMVAMFRAQMGEHLGDPVWEGFLERLLTHSSEFRDTAELRAAQHRKPRQIFPAPAGRQAGAAAE